MRLGEYHPIGLAESSHLLHLRRWPQVLLVAMKIGHVLHEQLYDIIWLHKFASTLNYSTHCCTILGDKLQSHNVSDDAAKAFRFEPKETARAVYLLHAVHSAPPPPPPL